MAGIEAVDRQQAVPQTVRHLDRLVVVIAKIIPQPADHCLSHRHCHLQSLTTAKASEKQKNKKNLNLLRNEIYKGI